MRFLDPLQMGLHGAKQTMLLPSHSSVLEPSFGHRSLPASRLLHVYPLGSIAPESFLPIILVNDLDENVEIENCCS